MNSRKNVGGSNDFSVNQLENNNTSGIKGKAVGC